MDGHTWVRDMYGDMEDHPFAVVEVKRLAVRSAKRR